MASRGEGPCQVLRLGSLIGHRAGDLQRFPSHRICSAFCCLPSLAFLTSSAVGWLGNWYVNHGGNRLRRVRKGIDMVGVDTRAGLSGLRARLGTINYCGPQRECWNTLPLPPPPELLANARTFACLRGSTLNLTWNFRLRIAPRPKADHATPHR